MSMRRMFTCWLMVWCVLGSLAWAAEAPVEIEPLNGGLLEVKVTDTDKKPLAGAKVNVAPKDVNRWQTLTSDANGIASVRLIAGQYTLGGVYKKNYMRAGENEPVTIDDGKTTRLDMEMKGSPKISGVVRDAAGKPVAGAEIQTIPFGGGKIKSDAVGAFEMQWDPERWGDQQVNSILVARHIERNLAAVVDIDEDTGKLEVTVSGGITFAGKVVDAESKPIAGADVSVILHTSNYGSGLGSSQVRTDKNGSYEYKAIPVDMRYSVQASADGYGQSSADVDTGDAAGGRVEVEPLTLKMATLSISGIVVDANDKPVADAEVYVNGDGQQYRRSRTDANGKFRIEKLCEGQIEVNAQSNHAEHAYGNVSASAGDTDVKVAIFPSGSRSRSRREAGQSVSLSGKPLPDLAPFNLVLDPNTTKDKAILLCFFDYNQRPSRHCYNELGRKHDDLTARGVFVAGIRFGDSLVDLEQTFPVVRAKGFEETGPAWGIKSLPWLILTNKQHRVIAEGFGISDIDGKVKAAVEESR